MKKIKIGLAIDTNILRPDKDFLNKSDSILRSVELFSEYISDLKKANDRHQLMLYLPKMVLDELFCQKENSLKEAYHRLIDGYARIGYALNGEIPCEQIEETMLRERESVESNCTVIDLIYTEGLFQEILYDAANKKAPFDKSNNGKKSDAGFKDAVIWKTILNSTEINECSEFYFFSNDKVFLENKEELESQFKERHPQVRGHIVCPDTEMMQRQGVLSYVIKTHGLIETQLIKLYNEDGILEEIIAKGTWTVLYEECTCSREATGTLINFCLFDINDFVIKDVSRNNNEYNINLEFKTKKYTRFSFKNDPNAQEEDELYGKILIVVEDNRRLSVKKFCVSEVFFSSESPIETFFSRPLINLKKNLEILTNSISKVTSPFDQITPFCSCLEDIPRLSFNSTTEKVGKNMGSSCEEYKTTRTRKNSGPDM